MKRNQTITNKTNKTIPNAAHAKGCAKKTAKIGNGAINGKDHSAANGAATYKTQTLGVTVTRHKSKHGPVSKSLTLKDGKLVSSPCCQIYDGRSYRVRLDDWRDFAKLIDQTPLDEAWSLGAMRADRADRCDIKTKSPKAYQLMSLFDDVITRSRDMVDYLPDTPAFILMDFDADGMTSANRQRLEEAGGFFGAMKLLLPGFDKAAYVWRPSTSSQIYEIGSDQPLKETQNLHCYLLAQDGSDAERFLHTLLDRAWLLGFGWIKVAKDGKALVRGIIDASTSGGERLSFEGGPRLGPGLEQRDRCARVHDGPPYDTRLLLDLTEAEQLQVLRLKNAAKSDLGLKTRQEKAARQFKAEKTEELVKRGMPKERAERAVQELVGGVRKLAPDFPLEFDDGRVITVKGVLLNPAAYIGETMADPIEGHDRGRNIALIMERGNGVWSFAHGETLYFFMHDFDTLKAAVENAPEREAASTLAQLLSDAVVTETEKATLIKIAKQQDGVGVADVRNVIKTAERERRLDANKKARAETGKPQINLYPGAIVDVVVEVDRSLVAAKDVKIFRRDRDLVRPQEIEMPASDKRKTTIVGLKPFKSHDLSVAMAVAADFYRPNKDGELAKCDPPISLAQKMIELSDKSRLPVIAGVITCPTLRPDGSVLSAPGFDAATGMYHFVDKTLDLSSLKDEPDRDDALEALALLEGLLIEFPFVAEVDKTVEISAMLTNALRAMFPVVPGHGFTAPDAGTGKSFLADLCSLIVSGKNCPVLAACQNEHEFEKQLSTALFSGCGLISVDNRVEPLTGGLLCQAVTQTLITLRPYGQNERDVTVINRVAIQANGNNLQVSGDATRRFIIGCLDAKVERPELRTFAHNPRAIILADRGKYVAACLTIVRAYVLAGQPGKLSPLASFDEWSDNIRSALVWLGRQDIVDTLDAARETDSELTKLQSLMSAFIECYGSGPDHAVTLQQMCRDAKSGAHASAEPNLAGLSNALGDICGSGNADRFDHHRLGYWLRGRKDKIVNCKRFISVRDAHLGTATWHVEDLS